MIVLEIERHGPRGPVIRRLKGLDSPRQCFGLARRLLRHAGVLRCRCRNGGFVTDIDRDDYRTRRDLSIGIGE